MAMTMETRSATESEISDRNILQHDLLQLYIDNGEFDDKNPDFIMMSKIFRQVSDIIDGEEEQFSSIRAAYQSGDNHGAAMMLKTVIKL